MATINFHDFSESSCNFGSALFRFSIFKIYSMHNFICVLHTFSMVVETIKNNPCKITDKFYKDYSELYCYINNYPSIVKKHSTNFTTNSVYCCNNNAIQQITSSILSIFVQIIEDSSLYLFTFRKKTLQLSSGSNLTHF